MLFARRKKTASPKPKKGFVREWVEAILVALVIALILRTFVVQAFKIPSSSMEDTLLIGDHLLVNKFIYGTKLPFGDERYFQVREPQRGDVIVFEFPPDTHDPRLHFWQKRDFIKRIIGLPGDQVEIRAKTVYVNGEEFHIPSEVFKEDNLKGECFEIGDWRKRMRLPSPFERDCMLPTTVPAGHYFVLGDNRDRSHDSRFWGFVPMENIKGLAFIKYWSWDALESWPRFSRIGRPID